MRDSLIAFTLFVFVYAAQANLPVIQSSDSAWSLPTALSIIHDGDLDLKEFRKQIRARKKYGVRIRTNRKLPGGRAIYNFFPYGTSFLITPIVAVFESAPSFFVRFLPLHKADRGKIKTVTDFGGKDILFDLEKGVASLVVALCAVFWFFIARVYLSTSLSILLTLTFAFGTPALSTASRGLWQHGPVMLLTSVSIYLLLKRRYVPAFSGLPLAFSYLVRPTTALFWALSFVYLFFRERKTTLLYLALSALPIILFFYVNIQMYNRTLPDYYEPGRLGYHDGFFEALAASLISPSRGLLFQSPFLLVSLLSVFSLSQAPKEILYCLAACTAHLVVTSLFPNWWHGHCFGSRYMTDILPFLFLLTVLVFHFKNSKKLLASYLLLCVVSLPIHYKGATDYGVYRWNVEPINIDIQPSRVWSLTEAQFLR